MSLTGIKERMVPKVRAGEGDDDEEEKEGKEGEEEEKEEGEEEEEEEEEGEEEEDLVDPADSIKESCAEEKCSQYQARLDECNDRVSSKSNTTETCLEEILDFYHCVDHCAGDKIFKTLK